VGEPETDIRSVRRQRQCLAIFLLGLRSAL
jgi:hypothetical protein